MPAVPRRVIVDGMNVIGSRPDGWWRDRRGAMRRLVEEVRRHSVETGDEVTVVFDGAPFGLDDAGAGAPRALFAPRPGPGAADDRIVELVERDADSSALTVVTSDRDLGARVAARGARVQGAREFRGKLAISR